RLWRGGDPGCVRSRAPVSDKFGLTVRSPRTSLAVSPGVNDGERRHLVRHMGSSFMTSSSGRGPDRYAAHGGPEYISGWHRRSGRRQRSRLVAERAKTRRPSGMGAFRQRSRTARSWFLSADEIAASTVADPHGYLPRLTQESVLQARYACAIEQIHDSRQ